MSVLTNDGRYFATWMGILIVIGFIYMALPSNGQRLVNLITLVIVASEGSTWLANQFIDKKK